MDRYNTVLKRYCPVVSRNVAIEQTLNDDNSLRYECLNMGRCNCPGGKCENKLISEIDMGSVK